MTDAEKLTDLLEGITPLLPIGHTDCIVWYTDSYQDAHGDECPEQVQWIECDTPETAAAIVAVMNAAPGLIARVRELETENQDLQVKLTVAMGAIRESLALIDNYDGESLYSLADILEEVPDAD